MLNARVAAKLTRDVVDKVRDKQLTGGRFGYVAGRCVGVNGEECQSLPGGCFRGSIEPADFEEGMEESGINRPSLCTLWLLLVVETCARVSVSLQ